MAVQLKAGVKGVCVVNAETGKGGVLGIERWGVLLQNIRIYTAVQMFKMNFYKFYEIISDLIDSRIFEQSKSGSENVGSEARALGVKRERGQKLRISNLPYVWGGCMEAHAPNNLSNNVVTSPVM
ncbi:hypothetical protein DCAR_0209323 [Daucus carota subsp. sativus]|uniref:Uncharacterized protein n=1 Tax=Daucus carota subsp. sativus TaxID=79200 RepID=A0A166F6Q8_DAUCS|nr:hypothetical protein DCAR_0209323 [Daucus carota subsp. sativus]